MCIRDRTKLTTKESELLGLLCAHANEILQRDFALKTIWIDDNYFNARSMDVYLSVEQGNAERPFHGLFVDDGLYDLSLIHI